MADTSPEETTTKVPEAATKAEPPATVAEEEEREMPDFDRDSLHTLPLFIIPIETPALRHARLIKNAKLESVVELFRGKETGSGQISIDGVAEAFSWKQGNAHPDYRILYKLAKLPSYDVYSLRISLRNLGIQVDQERYLRLSDAKQAELIEYMRSFTEPLILHIYGDRNMDIQSHEDLINLFRNANVAEAREKLKLLASTLRIGLEDVPSFLEDYGDVFLSLSYYRRCLSEIEPYILEFLDSIDEIKGNMVLKENSSLMTACDELKYSVERMMTVLLARFDTFDQRTHDLWENLSADRFHEVESLIKSYHVTIGGALCALTVKMSAWANWFPTRHAGSPMKRAEFIASEMRQGIETIHALAAEAERNR